MTHSALKKEPLSFAPPPVALPIAESLQATFIEASPDYLEELTPEWNLLAAAAPNNEPFFYPYWFRAFAKNLLRGQPIPLVLVRDATRLRGVLPLMRKASFLGNIPAKTLGSLSGIHSCRYDFVCSRDNQEAISRAAWNCLKENHSWSALEALTVPQGGAFEHIMRHAREDGYHIARWVTLKSPYLNIPTNGQDPFANCPSRYKADRKRLEKYLRKLKQFGDVSFEVKNTMSTKLFHEFLELEGAGWKGENGGAIKCNPAIVAFYRDILSEATSKGQLRICSLNVGNTRAAMEMAFVVNNRCFSPKIAYNEDFSKCAPGQLLARHAIADLARKEIVQYDLLGARARHKALWAGEVREHANCYIFRPTIKGALYHSITAHIAPRIKQLKYAWYGDPQSLSDEKK